MKHGGFEKRTIQAGLVSLLLILITLAAYWLVPGLDFVNYDDGAYVYENPNVIRGLTLEGVARAFTGFCASNWHPLTMLSLMLDVQLFGINPAAHHLINLFFHLANTLLLFFFLLKATGRIWPCALTAALFAVHPLHVESVAWIAERKDVLSGFFGLGAMLAYVYHVRGPSLKRYAAAVGLLTLSLLSKAMLVTAPALFLLLDFWPLGRIEWSELKRRDKIIPLLVEKLPLLALSLFFGVMAIAAQDQGGALQPLDVKPLAPRLMNAVASYAGYLVKTFLPLDLAVFYPYPNAFPPADVLLSAAVLALVTVLAVRLRRRRPYCLTGWLWFLISLTPVIGLVQVGMQSLADRYTYLPLIGIFIVLAFGLADLVQDRRPSGKIAATLAAAAVLALAVLCHRQVGYWQNGETLFSRALAVTSNNTVASNGLGLHLFGARRYAEAEPFFLLSLALNPRDGAVHRALGTVYYEMRRLDEAEKHPRLAVNFRPEDAEANFWLATVLRLRGKNDGARALFRRAELLFHRDLQLNPTARRHNLLGVALAQQTRLAEAEQQFREAARLDPRYSEARSNLNKVLRLKNSAAPPPARIKAE
ncbi:MAG: tetratricopeptide repeat protein [Pseudomonadota bacterium]